MPSIVPPSPDAQDDESRDCGCFVHPRWCAWNGPCCDDCSHDYAEAHNECCGGHA